MIMTGGTKMLDRRSLILGGGVAAVGLGTAPRAATAQGITFAPPPPIVPVIARRDRMYRVTVCLRPFLPTGPRIELERVGGKQIVHHYGHGGSGWSLSWGSAQVAVPLALARGRRIAVVGAGCIGLTSAITAQRMGADVTIYTKDRFPDTRSAWATGAWTPSSRIAHVDPAGPDFPGRWERMARASFAMHQSYLGMPGDPVEWTDRYLLSDTPAEPRAARLAAMEAAHPGRAHFAELDPLIADMVPKSQPLTPDQHPFPTAYARRTSTMTYNVAAYCRQLEAEFLAAGGRFVRDEFKSVRDLRRIAEPVVMNCTGYAAKALFGDERLVPVRGQIAWLLPQPGVTYGIYYRKLSVLARRDGIVVQPLGDDDYFGFGDDSEAPDMAAAYSGVDDAAALFAGKG